MDELVGLQKILAKLMILNSNRMAQIRNSFIVSKDEEAEYEERFSEHEWYNKAVAAISQQLLVKEVGVARDTLKKNIKAKLESRYDEVLENIRKAGAGHMVDESLISQEDREFLGSCGIKADRGERW